MKIFKNINLKNVLLIILISNFVLSCGKDDEPLNKPPTANAGSDYQAEIGSVVKVDASGSTDPDGNTLTYQWSFLSKPDGSVAAIVGVGSKQAEFTLDKAGTYELQVTVSDGTTNTQDAVTITNKAPVLNEVETQKYISSLDHSIAEKGKKIFINGLYFSPDASENKFSLGGVDCELLNFDDEFYTIEVPENALAGDLVVTVGAHSVTWSQRIRLLDPPVINAFIESDNTLEESVRYNVNDYKEIGTVFTPLVNGTIVALGLKTPVDGNGNRRVTLWNVNSKTNLVSLEIYANKNIRYKALETPIAVKADEKYMISLFNNHWYNYMHGSQDNIYPKTVNEHAKLEYLAATEKYEELNDNYDFPDEDTQTFYISLGADFVFVPDIE